MLRFIKTLQITQANKRGILPDEFVKRFPLKIIGENELRTQPAPNELVKKRDSLTKELNDHLNNRPELPPEDQRYEDRKADGVQEER